MGRTGCNSGLPVRLSEWVSERPGKDRLLPATIESAWDVLFCYRCLPRPRLGYRSPIALALTGYSSDEFCADSTPLLRSVPRGERRLRGEFPCTALLSPFVVELRCIRTDGRFISMAGTKTGTGAPPLIPCSRAPPMAKAGVGQTLPMGATCEAVLAALADVGLWVVATAERSPETTLTGERSSAEVAGR